jgi:hypothetical protein
MKTKLYLLILTACFVHSAFAQNETPPTEKFLVSGSAGFNYSESKSGSGSPSKSVTAQLSPLVGYCVYKNMYAGLTLTGSYSNLGLEDTDYNQVQFGIHAGPFFRYYFIAGLFGHIQGNIGYLDISMPFLTFDPYNFVYQWIRINSSAMEYGLDLGIGYDIKLSDHVYLEPMIRYSVNKQDYKERDQIRTNNQFIFNLGITSRF